MQQRSPSRWIPDVGRDWAAMLGVTILSLWALAKIGEDVFSHETTAFDNAVQGWILAHQLKSLEAVFLAITVGGGITGMCVVALAGACFLWWRRRHREAVTVLVAPVVAIAFFNISKRVYARPRPAGLTGVTSSSYAFPSGHATVATAVCGTLAYVLYREGFIPRGAGIALAVSAPLLVGVSRVYLNVHWATDVLGGWSAGLLIVLLSVLLYNRQRR